MESFSKMYERLCKYLAVSSFSSKFNKSHDEIVRSGVNPTFFIGCSNNDVATWATVLRLRFGSLGNNHKKCSSKERKNNKTVFSPEELC